MAEFPMPLVRWSEEKLSPRLVRGSKNQRPEQLWRHALGHYLRLVRRTRAETLDQIAERSGVSPQYLSEIERGLKDPSSEMIAAVAGALDLSLVDLTTGISESLQAGQRSVPSSSRAGSVQLALVA